MSIRPSAGVDALYAPRRTCSTGSSSTPRSEAGADVLHETSVTALLRDEQRPGARRSRGRAAADAAIELPAVDHGRRRRHPLDRGRTGRGTGRPARSVRPRRVLYRYVSGLPADGYEWAYGDGAAAGLIPTNDGRDLRLRRARPPSGCDALRRAGTEHAFATLLAPGSARVCSTGCVGGNGRGRMHGWGGAPGYVRQSWGPGWALVGDAGYFKDPITTHGMTDALRDAELLADADPRRERRRAAARRSRLRAYQATRDRLSGELFAATEEVAALRLGHGRPCRRCCAG